MNTTFKPLSWALLLSVATGIAMAQEAPPAAPATAAPGTAAPGGPVKGPSKSTAQIDAGEPRANTSAPSAGSTASGAAPGAVSPTAASASAPGTAPAGTALPRNPPRAAAVGRSQGAAGQKAPGAVDRVELGTATVTGDREQPKVMYIVPWKKSDIGDLSGKPMNSLLDEALAPVDRDEFKREVAYYDAVKSDASQSGAPNPASKQGEK
jgi:hypothetical protein